MIGISLDGRTDRAPGQFEVVPVISSRKARVVEVGLKMPKEDMVLPFRDMAHHQSEIGNYWVYGMQFDR